MGAILAAVLVVGGFAGIAHYYRISLALPADILVGALGPLLVVAVVVLVAAAVTVARRKPRTVADEAEDYLRELVS
jgi:uncharacterized membrane protein YfcA